MYVKHFRVVARFEIGAPNSPIETATCALNFHPGATDNWGNFLGTQEMDAVEHVYGAWATFMQSAGGKFSSRCYLTECRGYVIGTDGRMEGDPFIYRGTPTAGNTGTNIHPPQCSVALSLIGEHRGPGRWGRIYLPPQGIPVDPESFVMSQGNAELLLADAKTFIETASNIPLLDDGWGVVVASNKGAGINNKVVAIGVGRAIDTQRRRRRDLDEQKLLQDVST